MKNLIFVFVLLVTTLSTSALAGSFDNDKRLRRGDRNRRGNQGNHRRDRGRRVERERRRNPRPYYPAPRRRYPAPRYEVKRVCEVGLYDRGYLMDTFKARARGIIGTGVIRRACDKAYRKCENYRRYGEVCRKLNRY